MPTRSGDRTTTDSSYPVPKRGAKNAVKTCDNGALLQ